MEQSAVVHAIVHALADVDLEEISRNQQQSDEETPSSLKLGPMGFPGIDQQITCDVSQGRPLVLVLEGSRFSVFEKVHGLAHPSGKAMLAIMARAYVWRNMRRDVLRWARQCRACATSKIARHVKPPVRPIPVPEGRFQHVHVDIVGPFVQDRGKKYLLTMVDRTTRWPEAVPITDTMADTVVQAFLEGWIERFGIPHTVTTDRGAQFTSGTWKTAMAQLGASVSATTAYHPQANGMVERFHHTLKDALRCSSRTNKSWTRALPWVMLGLRNAPKLDTTTSVAEVLFGVPLRVPGLCFQDVQGQKRTAQEELELARSNAREFLPKTLDLRRFKSSPFMTKSLRTAAFVYIRDDRLGKPSLAPRYCGPFKVKKKCWESNTFVVDMGTDEDKISIERLKAAEVPPEAW